MSVGSEPATSGSVMAKHDRMVPSHNGRREREVDHRVSFAPAGQTDPMALPQGPAKVAAVRHMFDTIAPRYDLVNRVMTFRMDVGWRRATVDALGLRKGARVLDLASG